MRAGTLSCSKVYPQHLEWCPAHCKCSVDACWMNRSKSPVILVTRYSTWWRWTSAVLGKGGRSSASWGRGGCIYLGICKSGLCLPKPRSSQIPDLSPWACTLYSVSLTIFCTPQPTHPCPPSSHLLTPTAQLPPFFFLFTQHSPWRPHPLATRKGTPDCGVYTPCFQSHLGAEGKSHHSFEASTFLLGKIRFFCVGTKSERARVMMVLIIAAIYRVPARC